MQSIDTARGSLDQEAQSPDLVTKSLDSMRESFDLGRESVDAERLSVDWMTRSLNPTTTSLFGAMRSFDPESVSIARLERSRGPALQPAIWVLLPSGRSRRRFRRCRWRRAWTRAPRISQLGDEADALPERRLRDRRAVVGTARLGDGRDATVHEAAQR
jgi:hypothetical protein